MSTSASNIEWTDRTWNPVRGCSRVSEGCRNCYAEKVAARFSGEEEGYESGGPAGWITTRREGPFHGFATQSPARWTGKVALVEKDLLKPCSWRKPVRVFVNSMSDLFHESLPFEDIRRVFVTMALPECGRHTFQVLTKRPERMLAFFEWARSLPVVWPWPDPLVLPNVWLGVSVEDQRTADERIPLLLQTPAAVRFVSAEPLLGGIDFRPAWIRPQRGCDGVHVGRCGDGLHHHHDEFCGPRLDWIITGGESGPGARPCDIAWIWSIVGQCKAAGVACFAKQIGARPECHAGDCGWPVPLRRLRGGPSARPDLRNRKGGDPAEWPEDLRVREFPD